MKIKTVFFLIGLLPAIKATCSSQADSTRSGLVLKHLSGHVYTLDGGLGNVAVSFDSSGILMVDTKSDKSTADIEQVFREQLHQLPVRFIINTHMHWDHTGGNKRLGKQAAIVAHSQALKAISEKEPFEGRPNTTFDSSMSIHFNQEEIRIIHFPNSHTDHDAVIYFTGSKVLAMGDMYFAGMFPYITDEGSLKGLIRNLGDIIRSMPSDIKIIPGHGPVSSLDDLRSTQRMLVETSEFIRQQIAAGKTLEEIKKQGLPAKWESWSKGFCKPDCWIETVYEKLSKE